MEPPLRPEVMREVERSAAHVLRHRASPGCGGGGASATELGLFADVLEQRVSQSRVREFIVERKLDPPRLIHIPCFLLSGHSTPLE